MAKGGINKRSNGSRLVKPYDASNSFVKKVALRVSDYIGGLFGSTRTEESVPAYTTSFRGNDDTNLTHSHYETTDAGKSVATPRRYDDPSLEDSPGKKLKIGTKRKFVPDLPISPITSSSSLFQSSVPHNFDIQNSEDFITSVAGPSGLQTQKYAQTNSVATATSTNTNIKANGATDNHSDSSESTSGCSSLVPQSDRLSQSAFVSNSRKKILEEKLQYARQLKQTRASMYLNRSIPVVSDTAGSRRKPSFDVSVYGSPIFDKSSVREKMVSSPFYTGQTSYGGASAYRRPRTALYSQQSVRPTFERKDGLQIQVKPSHHGSTEDLSNMSHTAKRILEALEQFSTPISDAKRIPVTPGCPPLARKRIRMSNSLESTASLPMTKIPAKRSKGPLISGLNIPTVPDLLKLKRLEKIQDSTTAARQVAVQKQEYSLPCDVAPSKHTGKIVSKSRDKEKEVTFERPPEVNLPKIPLPISTLPKFDFKMAAITPATTDHTINSKQEKTTVVDEAPSLKDTEPNKTFKFSPPISLSVPENIKNSSQKSNFTFSTPLNANAKSETSENVMSNLSNFMSAEALSKLKRKSVNDKPNSTFGIEPAKELKSGSVMDLLRKTLESNKKTESKCTTEESGSANDTWECSGCLLRNLKDTKNCTGCKAPKISVPTSTKTLAGASPVQGVSSTDSKPVNFSSGFGNKFKPPSDSWSCKECFVNNNATATKCIACENPKPGSNPPKETVSQMKPPPVTGSGFGDLFKKKAGQWECSVCLIQNKEGDVKCAACETPKPGPAVTQSEPPKLNSGFPADAGGFKFGIDRADVKDDTKNVEVPKAPVVTQTNVSHPEPGTKPFGSVATSVGVFTFGIPPAKAQPKEDPKTDIKQDSSKTVEPEKSFLFGEPAKAEGIKPANANEPTPEKTLECKDVQPKTPSDSVDTKGNEPTKTNASPGKNNFLMKQFSAETPSKTPTPMFSFGSQGTPAKPAALSESTSATTNTVFGSGFKMPESIPSSNVGFTFGQSNPVNTQLSMNNPVNNGNDISKSLPLFSFNFSGKNDPAVSAPSTPAVDPSLPAEVSNSTATSISLTTTTTTNLVFGSSVFKDSNVKLPFGTASNTNEFGGGNKTSNPSEALSVTSTASATFPSSTPIFSAASSVFNGPAVPAATNSFGSLPSSAAPFTTSTTQGFNTNNSEQGFRPSGEPFASPAPAFGGGNNQMAGFRLFSTPSNNFGSAQPSAFGANPTSAPSFGSSFGQPAAPTEKPITPFVFGEKNNNTAATTAPAAPTTAPNVFTFGAPKQEAKPPQFSGGFGQTSGGFSFGSPNPQQGNLFGNFNQPKTASPFVNTNSTFGNPTPNPFGQSSAPATFGGAAPNFEFGSSSQQTQSNPQPFQFGASNLQAQPNSAPGANFSIAVPQTFNFTGGQAPTVFSATPTGPPPSGRRVLKATRRTLR